MLGDTYNLLVSPPKWSPHRRTVAAADTVPVTTATEAQGVKCGLYRWGLARVRLASGVATSIKVRPVFWDGVNEEWYPDPAIAEQNLGTTHGQIAFEAQGRTFFIAVTVLTGTAPKLDIDIAGFGRTG